MRRRYRWSDEAKALIEIPVNARQESVAPIVWNDLPGYESPVSGKWVEGRKARREDLKRTGCRAWEGMDQEKKEAARVREYSDQQFDRKLESHVGEVWRNAPERIRKVFR